MQVNLQQASPPTPYNNAAIANVVLAFNHAERKTIPYTHWLFENALPPAMCNDIIALPIAPAEGYDTQGKRDNHNELRRFISPEMRGKYPVLNSLADLFQNAAVIRSIANLCGVSFSGSYLRIEYCQDSDGFWLEPHMDIKEKLVTIQIYLNTHADADDLGTDIYNADKNFFGRAPASINKGMIFVPREPNSFHGFEKRKIMNIRRSLIINYVSDDWRSRHELAFPDNKIA